MTPALGAKPLALLAFLLLERRAHSREMLAGLLWGESPEAEARASLRQALKHLRDAVGETLQADRTAVDLSDGVGSDVLEFLAAADQNPQAAAGFEVARFLQGFSIRHAPQFEEWVAATRTSLLRRQYQVLGRLAREAMAQWRWREAVELADRWLEGETVSDEAAQLAVEARYMSGNRSSALSRYAEFRTHLAAEAGCEPSRALQALVHRIEADRATNDNRPITDEWYAHAPSFESSLVGREPQWKALTSAWKQVSRGHGRIMLVEGESGVGKTRLADEFLRWVVAEGGTVLRGRCYDRRAGVPYEPVVEALRGAMAAPGLAGTSPEWLVEVARVIPELRERFPGLPPVPAAEATEGWRLFEGVAQLVGTLAAEQPVAMVIDDFQWCDEDSANLLRFLARRMEHAPVLWLGLLTLGDVERDAPASRLCRVLRAKAHADVITLGPLTEHELWQLIREMGHVTGPNAARRFASRLFRITAGNPFYVIELLKTMFAQGLLAMDAQTGEWTVAPAELRGAREVPLSQTVQDVIAERVDRLSTELRDALITIAVSGSGCRPDVLSHVHGISRLHAASIGDGLVDRHLVTETGGAYRCIHPVIAHLVRDGLTASRRQEVHRSLALALVRVLRPAELPDRAGELARHAERGDEPELAYNYALVAATHAVTRYAYTEAMSWLDLASASARTPEQAQAVDRRTAEIVESAGWSEVPGLTPLPVTREIMSEDFDLRVRG